MRLVVNIVDWRPRGVESREHRPRFENPVPCQLVAPGETRRVVPAHLRWAGSELVADIDLLASPYRFMHAVCSTDTDDGAPEGGRRRIRSIEVNVA